MGKKAERVCKKLQTRIQQITKLIANEIKLARFRTMSLRSLMAVMLSLMVLLPVVVKAVPAPLTPRFSTTLVGDVQMTGNAVLTCPSTDTVCIQALTDGSANGNARDMQYIDIDSDINTFNSSSAGVALPVGGAVVWAGLYWAGTTEALNGTPAPNLALREQVLFETPVSGGYVTVAGAELGSSTLNDDSYGAFADVTALVAAGGNGTYTVADVQVTSGGGSTGSWGSWALIVVYSDPNGLRRNIQTYDGYDEAFFETIEFPISGFITPAVGEVSASVGFYVGDGEPDVVTDSIQFDGQSLEALPLNPANSFFNSTVSRNGANITDRLPNDNYNLVSDIDSIDATGVLSPAQTSTNVTLVSNEGLWPIAMWTSIEVGNGLDIEKTSSANGGPVYPGDTITYTIEVGNSSTSVSAAITVSDMLPAGVSYVPGSSQLITNATMAGSFNPGPLAGTTFDTGGVTQSFTVTAADIPANAIVSSYQFSANGSSADWLSDIGLSTTFPSGPAFTLNGADFGGNVPGPFNVSRNQLGLLGSAVGDYSFIWTDGFNGVVGDDNTILATNLTIGYQYQSPTATPAGAPPDLLTSADSINLFPGSKITLTFDVVVDDPLNLAITEITNTATASGTGIGPVSDSATDLVGPRITIQKISNNDIGTFSFTGTNLREAISDLVTAVSGTAVRGDQIGILNVGGAVTITELVPINWTLASASCVDQSSSVTGNPGSFGGLLGSTLTIDAANVVIGANILCTFTNDGPLPPPGNISGVIWLDVDGDGVSDAGEPGISSLTVYLCAAGVAPCDAGSAIATAATDANGTYNFDDLAPGDYQVQVEQTELISGELDGLEETVGNNAGNTGTLSVTSGKTTDAELGYVPDIGTGVVEGTVWTDVDGDGIQDADEVGIPDATVELCPASDPTCVSSTPVTATTGADGSYILIGVPPGEYVVSVDPATVPAGYSETTPTISNPISVAPDSVVSDVDFGFNSADTSNISDAIWYDSDGDGVLDAGEQGIGGVTVDLYDCGSDNVCGNSDDIGVVASVTTSPDGGFDFSGLADGSYEVRISDNDGVLNAFDETTLTGGTLPVTVAGSDIDNTATPSFGYNQPGTITGNVFSDSSNDGGYDTNESGIAVDILGSPIIIELRDGVCTPGLDCPTTTVNADGSYSFDDIAAGSYTVAITNQPAGTATTLQEILVTIVVGGSAVDIDFGYNDPTLDDISGTVFEDLDSDGTFEPDGTDGNVATTADNELGLEGVTLDLVASYQVIDSRIDLNGDGVVNANDTGIYRGIAVIGGRLDMNGDGSINGADDGEVNGVQIINGRFDMDNNGSVNATNRPTDDGVVIGDVVATTTTAADGSYSFTDVPDGNYSVQVTDETNVLDGMDITSGLDQQDVTTDSSVVGNPDSIDFGYIRDAQTASISSGVWIDTDGDGIRDANETVLAGVDIDLIDCGADGICGGAGATDDTVVATSTTDADGNVIFPELPPGNYQLDIDETDPDLPPDFIETSYTGVDPNSPIALSEGEVYKADFGYVSDPAESAISGVLWSDADADGVRDSGEAPLAGITVTLLDSFGNAVTTTTGPDGSYEFTGLAPCPVGADWCYIVSYSESGVDATGLNGQEPTNTPDVTSGDPANPVGDGLNDTTYLVNVAVGEVAEDINFGFAGPDDPACTVDPCDPTVSDQVGSVEGVLYYEPAAGAPDGDFDAGIDTGIEQVTLNLLDASGNIIATTITSDGSTDANGDGLIDAADIGYYSFDGILPGSGYQVVVSDTNNSLIGLNPSGDPDEAGLCITCDGMDAGITVVANATSTSNFGYIGEQALGNIGNLIWLDVVNDGIFNADDGDTGLAGVTAQCWVDTDGNGIFGDGAFAPNGVDNLVRTVTTDANGEYYCEGLPTGTYFVRVTDVAGVLTGFSAATVLGGSGALTDTDNTNKIDIIADHAWLVETGSDNLTADFAVTGSFTIGGNVFIEDADLVEPNDDGTLAPDELDATPGDGDDSPAEGVTVLLLRQQPDGSFVEIASVLTDANGDYTFNSLPPGNYQVVVDPSNSAIDGFGQTADPDLASQPLLEDRVCDSNTAASCDNQTVIALSASVAGVNFGYQSDFTTTPVTVNYFKASRVGAGIEFNWESSNEVGHLGYQIYARLEQGWELLSEKLITREGGDNVMQTHAYKHIVYNVEADWFALVDVSTAEDVTPHGPYQIGQAYGGELQMPAEFDWSGIRHKSKPDSLDIQNSVQQRLLRLMDAQERPTRLQPSR